MENAQFPHIQANVTDVTDKSPENGLEVTLTGVATPSQAFCVECDGLLPTKEDRKLGVCQECREIGVLF
jgi:hypothetical protein